MASWKKVVVSGSAPELSNLQVDGLTASQVVIGGGSAGNLSTTAINGTGNILATTGATGVKMTGSFTGSFTGDGSGLTGVSTNAKFLVYQTGSGTNSIVGISDGSNTANGACSVNGGGKGNSASGAYSSLGGGEGNTASGVVATIAGGNDNTANGSKSAIGGGGNNIAAGGCGTVGGGFFNRSCGTSSTTGGGFRNEITTAGTCSTIGGGKDNVISGVSAVIAGGETNLGSGAHSAIGGGQLNTGSAAHSTIGGGCNNKATGAFSAVGGGDRNTATGTCSVVAGGKDNCTIGTSNTATIGGGFGNTINNGSCSAIGGGCGNQVTANFSTISGGYGGTVSATYSSVSGGYENTVSAGCSTVSGGYCNVVSAANSGILGGESNTVSGTCSGILGGKSNTANAAKSFIVGSDISSTVACHTHVNNLSTLGNITGSKFTGSFIGDGSQLTNLPSTAETLQQTMAQGSTTSIAITSSAGTILSGSGGILAGGNSTLGSTVGSVVKIGENGAGGLVVTKQNANHSTVDIKGASMSATTPVLSVENTAGGGSQITALFRNQNGAIGPVLKIADTGSGGALRVEGGTSHFDEMVNTSAVSATRLTGSFTGSFVGDGSALTNLPAAAIETYTGGVDNRIITAVNGTSVQGEANLTFDGSTLAVTGDLSVSQDATVTRDLTVSRNLIVQGTASFQHTTDLDIADRFIKMASGSTSNGSGGFAVQQTSATDSEALGWVNSSIKRWGVTGSFDATNNTFTPDAFLSLAVEGTGNDPDAEVAAKYDKKGNIFVANNQDIYIYS